MTAEAGDLMLDGGLTHSEGSGHLAVSHAANNTEKDLRSQVRALLPVGCREGLCTEGSAAMEARKTLDTIWGDAALEPAFAFEAPVRV